VYDKNNCPTRVQCYHGCYDPLAYPLLLPNGETGWHNEIPMVGQSMTTTSTIEMGQFEGDGGTFTSTFKKKGEVPNNVIILFFFN
jgi:hypothetical protein